MNNLMEEAALSFDKRKYPRIKMELQVKYKVINQNEEALALLEHKKAVQMGQAQDVSEQGLCLAGSQRLNPGDIIKLEVPLPEDNHLVRVFSEVIWSTEKDSAGRFLSGIYFMALKDQDAEKMKRFVEKTLAGNNEAN